MMALSIEKYLLQQLALREQQENKRSLFLRSDGIDFISNDYLGIARDRPGSPKVKGSIQSPSDGSTGSRLLSGNSAEAEALETYLSGFHETEAALLFNSGYDANLGLMASLANRHTTVFYDERCHASLLDGMRLSYAKQHFRFKHNDLQDLEEKLIKFIDSDIPLLVVIESIYSMEGDQAPLREVAALCEKYRAALIVDEAHATGIYGPNGAGLVQELGLASSVFARVHTFGKALGAHGAVIVGSLLLKEYLINFARSFVYTTALPPIAIQSIRSCYEVMVHENDRRAALGANIETFMGLREKSGLNWSASSSPIQSLLIGNNQQVKKIVKSCLEQKINVAAILSPTVAVGTERIRICLHSFNTNVELLQLFNILTTCLKK